MSNLNGIHANTPISLQDDLAQQSNLTASQFSIWVGQTLNPTASLYNMVHTFTIHGPIDPAKFEAAFQTLVDRSDAMRTIIDIENGVPQQRVKGDFRYTTPFVDFSNQPDPQATLDHWVNGRKIQLLDLAECLFDSVLLKLADDCFVWYLNYHHLMTDVLSFAIIYKRVAEFLSLIHI